MSKAHDVLFRSLADPTRRSLLDELFREDGQTLSALERRFSMTRIGVMKHLKQLEDAGLVATKRRGPGNHLTPGAPAVPSGRSIGAAWS